MIARWDDAEPLRRELGHPAGTWFDLATAVGSRQAGTRIAHGFRAGVDELTLVAYGTRDRNGITCSPRTDTIFFRGVGVVARLDHAADGGDSADRSNKEKGERSLEWNDARPWLSHGCFHDPTRGQRPQRNRRWHG